jgi:hypothetical protein
VEGRGCVLLALTVCVFCLVLGKDRTSHSLAHTCRRASPRPCGGWFFDRISPPAPQLTALLLGLPSAGTTGVHCCAGQCLTLGPVSLCHFTLMGSPSSGYT